MQVLKFGGTSVANSQNMIKVVNITTESLRRDTTMLVCSAISGCTDALIEIGHKAAAGDDSYNILIDCLESRHLDVISGLLPGDEGDAIRKECTELFATLREIAKGVFLIEELSAHSLATIESFGEILSTKIIHARFKANGIDAIWADSRALVRETDGTVNTGITYAAVRQMLSEHPDTQLFVLPGFIASDETGKTVTIGRGGSDYTASLYAAATNAARLEIWTDVPGMMTSNPKVVPTARTIPHISYRAALELSHFGAKVIYPPTIQPVVANEIPIYVKDTFHPEAYGTKIEANPPKENASDPIGICNSDDIALISLEGSAMVGVPGFSARLFAALSNAGINIILITQASSVHTMCLAIAEKDAALAKKASDECFAYEISLGKIQPLKIETGYSIVCLVGDNVLGRSGATGRMLAALGRRGIPVRATAQGSSERNISVIIPSERVNGALKYIHNEFFDRTNEKIIDLYIAGFGGIGSTLVQMVADNADKIAKRTCKRVRLCGLANSRKFILNEDGLDASRAKELLEKEGRDAGGGAFFDALVNSAGENAVFVDCTASEEVCNHYMFLIENGYNIIACNKIFFSSPYDAYRSVKDAAVAHGKSIKYETTVGAALPILESIARCVNSGDTLIKVEAVLSGTLNFLCSHYEGDDFQGLVMEAKRLGYTEPDPNEDLSGRDVLRKLIILCREAGVSVNEKDVKMEAFPVAQVKERYDAAASKGMKLRYVASLENGEARIELKAVGPKSPLYALIGTDNAAIITTTDYPSPLVVQGAGAGPRQTAGGLLNDILSI